MDAEDQPVLRGGMLNAVQRAGFMPILRGARDAWRSTVARWVEQGCPSPAPGSVKIAVVRSYVRSSGARRFVETGTFQGDTTEAIARTGVQCHTIEINPVIHARAQRVLGHYRNIDFILGDSADQMVRLLDTIDEPVVFWLDGHFSGGITGRSDIDTPISAELDAILNHPIRGHTILIDDAREFNGMHDYPHLSRVLAIFDDHPHYQASVSTDIIRITPRPRS
jgi:hypothetical protein